MAGRVIPCCDCGQALRNDEIALCVKLFGLAAPRLLCVGCAADLLDTRPETLQDLIEHYRASGCVHFQRDYLS